MAADVTATFDAAQARPKLELTRRFHQPIEKLWAALTVPARLADWMGVEWLGGSDTLQEGAAFDYRFRDSGFESRGRVLRFEPPFVLEHSWFDNLPSSSVVRWTLSTDGTGCRLTLVQHFNAPEDAPRTAAGWAMLLDSLAKSVGDDVAGTASLAEWRRLRDGFAQAFPPEATRDGRQIEIDGVPALRFERRLLHPCDSVWAALVEPAALARWLQADAIVEPYEGGRFHLKFHNFEHSVKGEIIRWEPPHLLEYTWPEPAAKGDSIVRWELAPAADGCVLVLTHLLRGGGDLADFGSGWHWHLDALDRALLGEAVLFDKTRWAVLRQVYAMTL